MKYRSLQRNPITILILFISLSCLRLAAEENPFIEMATQPYADYFEYLEKNIYKGIERRDSVWIRHIVAQMREAANISKNKKWHLEADYCEYHYHAAYNSLHKQNDKQRDNTEMIYTENLQSIVKQAKKIKAFDIELRVMYDVWMQYNVLKMFEMAFRYSLEFDKLLSKVSAEEFPFKRCYYSEIGKLYYAFREYETAVIFFEKGLEGAETARNQSVTNQSVVKMLWNNTGLIYRNHYHDLYKSDSCFLQILKMDFQMPTHPLAYDSLYIRNEYELWRGIAKGNLGHNCFLRGEYDHAIPLLKFGVEKAVEYNEYNFPYAIGKLLVLSEIFIAMSDLPQAKQYADKADDLLNRSQKRNSNPNVKADINLWADYYNIMSLYYRTAGNNTQALLYADSTAKAHAQSENEYNLQQLMRVQQQVNQEKLDAETFRSKTFSRVLAGISLFAFLLITLFCLLFRSYRKKQDAYRELVNKSQQWAEVHLPVLQTDKNELSEQEQKKNSLPDTEDWLLMDKIERLMTEEKIYTNHALTLELVANRIGCKQYLISGAINRCTKKDFSTFVSEYRIKEAIRLLSGKNVRQFSFDSIAFDSGFNNRQNFNRVFKKMIGVTPTEFLKVR